MAQPYSDLILTNARLLAPDAPSSGENLVAVSRGRIIHVGPAADLAALRRPGTRVVDCEGATLLPGFIDAHLHLFAAAASLAAVDCSPAAVSSVPAIVDAIRRAAARTPPGEWVRAWGYDEYSLREQRNPARWELDRAAPQHPVKLTHRSGHACVLNSAALQRLGIGPHTPEPPGAVLERDLASGELTGYCLEMEAFLESRGVPTLPAAEIERLVPLMAQRLAALGVTCIHDATPARALDQLDLLRRWYAAGRIPIRVRKMIAPSDVAALAARGLGYRSGDDALRIGPVKIMLNETAQRVLPDTEELYAITLAAQGAGFPCAFHAADESGLRAGLDAIAFAQDAEAKRSPDSFPRISQHEDARAARFPTPSPSMGEGWGGGDTSPMHMRHRIEHCGLCTPDLLPEIARLGVAVVTQPGFIAHHGDRYAALIPPHRRRWLYRIASLAQAGIPLAFGSDAPIAPPGPLATIAAAILRRTRAGLPIGPEEAVSLAQALACHTSAPAALAGDGALLGRIAPGYAADLVQLSGDPFVTPPEALASLRIQRTWVHGAMVWEE